MDQIAPPQVCHLIGGTWRELHGAPLQDVINPADGAVIAQVPLASGQILDEALSAVKSGFSSWKAMLPAERADIMLRAANIIENRLEKIAVDLTRESGKPLVEARMELTLSITVLRFYAEEGKRNYGRIVPPRVPGMRQFVIKEPVGPAIAFTAWNFPAINFMRKVAGALGAGCSILIKPDEYTPLTGIALARGFEEAGLPPGVLNVVYGDPATVSSHLCDSPIPRKLSFTGSIPIGQHLQRLAADQHIRTTMELGGHAPFIVFEDADLKAAAQLMIIGKFRNAGQVCVSPSRFYAQESVYEEFVSLAVKEARNINIGDGLVKGTTMGPLIHERRVKAISELKDDALMRGSKLAFEAEVPNNSGTFFPATLLRDVPEDARIMNEEPFGPVAPMASFSSLEEVMFHANKLPHGLAAYAFTTSAATAARISADINAGMCAINSLHINSPETPFGGVDASGHGSEGGVEGLECYLRTRLVTEIHI